MKKLFYMLASAVMMFLAAACQPEDVKDDNGITSMTNPMEGKSVYYKGETVEIKFKAEAAWTADLEFANGSGWAQITRQKGN